MATANIPYHTNISHTRRTNTKIPPPTRQHGEQVHAHEMAAAPCFSPRSVEPSCTSSPAKLSAARRAHQSDGVPSGGVSRLDDGILLAHDGQEV